ncbi:hypothetical protein SUDANB171_01181 [Streptomyces sp. enrichment culture]|jgi:hypothetical protein|uniref:DUF6227 family protein n=1 Tax=Streptomyces xiamenensis TaxID=408015 RepID=UPI0036E5120A
MTDQHEAAAATAADTFTVLDIEVPAPRGYPGQDSSRHARRLLGRAENADRPGEDILRLLLGARGYGIERLPEPRSAVPGERRRWCSVYEHAFLLADDSELCLYELEHDLTPDRRLVCEVYRDEVAAGRAARRHAHALAAAG